MVDLNDLPEGQEGSGDSFSGLDPERAMAMLGEVPNADIHAAVEALSKAQDDYKQHANARRFLVEAIGGLGTVAGIAKTFLA